jgi:hypothetical protein
MTILENDPWRMINIAESAARNAGIHGPSAIIAIHLCNQKGVDPYAWAGNALANWQSEIYIALLHQAIVELELGED